MSDLLDMADMEAGRLRIESVELDVRHLVEDVAGELRVPRQSPSICAAACPPTFLLLYGATLAGSAKS